MQWWLWRRWGDMYEWVCDPVITSHHILVLPCLSLDASSLLAVMKWAATGEPAWVGTDSGLQKLVLMSRQQTAEALSPADEKPNPKHAEGLGGGSCSRSAFHEVWDSAHAWTAASWEPESGDSWNLDSASWPTGTLRWCMCVSFSHCAWGFTAILRRVANPSTPGEGEDMFAASSAVRAQVLLASDASRCLASPSPPSTRRGRALQGTDVARSALRELRVTMIAGGREMWGSIPGLLEGGPAAVRAGPGSAPSPACEITSFPPLFS